LGGCSDLEGVSIAGILGDQQAALFGQACFKRGEAKCTYGTGAFLMMNTGEELVRSKCGLLTTLGYQLGKGAAPVYALEGSIAYCGSLIQWLRDNLQIIDDAAKSESLALTVEDNGGVYFVPAFSGLFAPYWRPDARGLIVGLTAYNTKAHITRAALEAAAFQTNEILLAMQTDAQMKLDTLRVDGGMTKNALLMQFQCDLIATNMSCPAMAETTAIGSAYAAALAVGFYSDKAEVISNWRKGKAWQSDMEEGTRARLLRDWRKAVSRSVNWVEREDEGNGSGVASRAANDSLIAALVDTKGPSVQLSVSVSKKVVGAVAVVLGTASLLALMVKARVAK
jgi:glycerol kinase